MTMTTPPPTTTTTKKRLADDNDKDNDDDDDLRCSVFPRSSTTLITCASNSGKTWFLRQVMLNREVFIEAGKKIRRVVYVNCNQRDTQFSHPWEDAEEDDDDEDEDEDEDEERDDDNDLKKKTRRRRRRRRRRKTSLTSCRWVCTTWLARERTSLIWSSRATWSFWTTFRLSPSLWNISSITALTTTNSWCFSSPSRASAALSIRC